MGGSNSGRWTPTSSTDKCATLEFDAHLNSPQVNALATLVLNEILSVTLTSLPKQVVQVVKGNLLVGVLTGSQTSQLISCLQNGYEFKAKVLSVTGAMCSVRVSPL